MLLNLLAVTLVIGGVAVTARWPSWSFAILYPALWPFWAIYLPFVDGRPERVFGALGIVGAVFVAKRRHLSFRLPKAVEAGCLLLFAGFTSSWLASGDLNGGFASLVGILTRILFLFLVYAVLQTRRHLELATQLYIAAGLVATVLSVWVSLTYGFGFARVGEQAGRAIGEAGIDVINAAYSANFNTVTGVLLLALAPTVRNSRKRGLTVALAAIAFASAFAAQFRREIVLTIPVVLFLLALDKTPLVRRTAVMFLIAGTLLFVFVVYPNSAVTQARFGDDTSETLRGEDIRSVSFIAGVRSYAESPLIGVGPGNYSVASVKQLGGYAYADNLPYQGSFNTFLSIAVEAGITGLVGAVMVFYGVWSATRAARLPVEGAENVILRAAPSLLAIIVIWFNFGNAYELSQPWFLMGLMLAANRLKRNTDREEQRNVRTVRLARTRPVWARA